MLWWHGFSIRISGVLALEVFYCDKLILQMAHWADRMSYLVGMAFFVICDN